MAAQALYLKYRPLTFDEVVGQEPITQTLRNGLRQDKLRHAYLFTGPRGTGKTTTARLLAKAVNCRASEEERPCNACPTCIAINEGRMLDLIEIDAASNRGIDEIRDIREKVGFLPNVGRFKVYVLDEAHMLTEPAFNALLKTLEEPPPHVMFALVTTDPHKIPATIASRCQRFDFRRIPLQGIIDRLAYIAGEEGLAVEPAALELIARHGTGALRDAISLLDQLASYGDEISLAQVQMVLGTVAGEAASRLAVCLADGDVAGGLLAINRAVGDGADPRQFGREVVEYLRGLLLIREGTGTGLLSATAEQAAEMETLAERMPLTLLLRSIRLFNDAATDLRRGLQTVPQLALELALVESTLGYSALGDSALDESALDDSVLGESALAHADGQTFAGPSRERQDVAQQEMSSPASGERRVAETLSSVPEQEPVAAQKSAIVEPEPAPEPQSSAGGLALRQVEAAWPQVLHAVRLRNPATQGVLNTGCDPVGVNGNEVVVAFPFPFLGEKLGDPQRKEEIQQALSEVLGTKCRLKLVLASEYKPEQKPLPAPATLGAEPPAEPEPPALDDRALDEIAKWAEERGGKTKLIES